MYKHSVDWWYLASTAGPPRHRFQTVLLRAETVLPWKAAEDFTGLMDKSFRAMVKVIYILYVYVCIYWDTYLGLQVRSSGMYIYIYI